MRQQIPVLLAAIVILALGWVGYQWAFGSRAGIVLQVLEAKGSVSRIPGAGGRAEAASAGLILGSSDALRVGEDGSAVVGVGEETRLTLASNSTIRVVEANATGVRIELEEGRVSARVRPGTPPLEVTSGGRGVRALDADFTVVSDAEGAFAVETSRGEVDVSGVGAVTRVLPGQRLRDLPGQAPLVGEIPAELLLSVDWPAQGTVRADAVQISGITDPYAAVRARSGTGAGTAARAGPDGRFTASVPLTEGANAVSVEVKDVVGNVAKATGEVQRESTAPTATHAEVLWGP